MFKKKKKQKVSQNLQERGWGWRDDGLHRALVISLSPELGETCPRPVFLGQDKEVIQAWQDSSSALSPASCPWVTRSSIVTGFLNLGITDIRVQASLHWGSVLYIVEIFSSLDAGAPATQLNSQMSPDIVQRPGEQLVQ